METLIASLPIRNDPWYQICLRAEREKKFEKVRDQILEGRRAMEEGRLVYNMDGGPYFHDTRAASIITAPATSITGATTDKLLHPGSLTSFPAGYLVGGKKVRLTYYLTIATGATPGNLGIDTYVGTVDQGTTLIASSTVVALNASIAARTMIVTAYLKSNGGAVEEAKPVESYGTFTTALSATDLITVANYQVALGNGIFPASAPAAVNINNTLSTNGFNIQMKNSGANANTYICRDITFESLT